MHERVKSQAINTISQQRSKGPVISQSNGVNHPLPVSIRYLWAIRFLCRQGCLVRFQVPLVVFFPPILKPQGFSPVIALHCVLFSVKL